MHTITIQRGAAFLLPSVQIWRLEKSQKLLFITRAAAVSNWMYCIQIKRSQTQKKGRKFLKTLWSLIVYKSKQAQQDKRYISNTLR